MSISGFVGTTTLDFPGKVAAIVFFAGCNFRCPFCHNPEMVLGEADSSAIDAGTVLGKIEKRKNFLDGVVVSGGEPLMQAGLTDFLKKIQRLELPVKLDTNGSFPKKLESLIRKKLISYVAMDIKALPENYLAATGNTFNYSKVKDSAHLLLNSNIDYEFRTTMAPGIVSPQDVPVIARLVRGARRYTIQQFKPGKTLDPGFCQKKPFSAADLKKAQQSAGEYIENVKITNI